MLLLQFSIVKILVHHTGSLAVFFFLAWLDTLDCVFSIQPLVLPFFATTSAAKLIPLEA